MSDDFMRVFEAKALAQALTDSGHSVSERTAQRWKNGETKPKPQDVRAIRALVGAMLPDTTKEAAPPEWAERLERKMDQIAAQQGIVADEAVTRLLRELAPPGRVADVEALAAELRRLPPPSGEAAHDSPASEDPGTAEPAGQGSL